MGSYTVSGPHGSVEVSDNFTLADTVMEAVVGDKTVVTQLIARDASGGLRIRYKNRVSHFLNGTTISLGGIHGNINMHNIAYICVSRYKGTALNVSVLPAAAAALKPIMPVKVPYFLSLGKP